MVISAYIHTLAPLVICHLETDSEKSEQECQKLEKRFVKNSKKKSTLKKFNGVYGKIEKMFRKINNLIFYFFKKYFLIFYFAIE